MTLDENRECAIEDCPRVASGQAVLDTGSEARAIRACEDHAGDRYESLLPDSHQRDFQSSQGGRF